MRHFIKLELQLNKKISSLIAKMVLTLDRV